MVKSHFSPDSAVSLFSFAGSISTEPVMDGSPSDLAAFLSYFLVLFPQFCPSRLPSTLAPSTQVLLGKGQPPLCTEQPAIPVLFSRNVANRLFSSLLPQPSKDRVKQMASCLMNSQPVCQLGLCSVYVISCLPKLGFSTGASAPAGISSRRWGAPPLSPQTLVPKVSLCSDQLFPESSQAFSRTSVYGWASVCVM